MRVQPWARGSNPVGVPEVGPSFGPGPKGGRRKIGDRETGTWRSGSTGNLPRTPRRRVRIAFFLGSSTLPSEAAADACGMDANRESGIANPERPQGSSALGPGSRDAGRRGLRGGAGFR